MDVLPSEEEQMLKNLAREFLEGECPPGLARAMELDEMGYPPELWKKMAEDGLFAHNLMGSFQSGINHGSVQVMRDQMARRGLGLPRG